MLFCPPPSARGGGLMFPQNINIINIINMSLVLSVFGRTQLTLLTFPSFKVHLDKKELTLLTFPCFGLPRDPQKRCPKLDVFFNTRSENPNNPAARAFFLRKRWAQNEAPAIYIYIYIYMLWSYYLGQVWPFQVLLCGPSRCYYLGQVVFSL